MINSWCDCCCSVAKLCPSLSPHGLQHTRLPWPSPSPGVCSNSCPLSQWCHHLLFCCPLFFLPSSFPSTSVFSNELALWMRWPNIGALASVLPMNIQGWFPLGLTGLISLQSKGFSRVFSRPTIWNHQFFSAQPSLWSHIKRSLYNSHICVCMLVTQLCPTLCNPMDCSPPGSSANGISQARILEWVAVSFSRGYSGPRDTTQFSWIEADSSLTEPPGKPPYICTWLLEKL